MATKKKTTNMATKKKTTVDRLLLTPALVMPYAREDRLATMQRFEAVKRAWPSNGAAMQPEDLSIVRELFGTDFLTARFKWTVLDAVEVK